MTENDFNGYLADELRQAGLSLVWKINDRFASGTPDFFLEGARRDLWMESKFIKPIPRRDHTLIDLTNEKRYLSRLQQRWLHRRFVCRRDTAVIMGSSAGCLLLLGLSWTSPIKAGDFRRSALSRKETATRIVTLLGITD